MRAQPPHVEEGALAGEEADPEIVALISARYGLDEPLFAQYLRYLGAMVTLDFGDSLRSQTDALALVLDRIGATLLLAVLALAITAAISIPLGAWLGFRPGARSRRSDRRFHPAAAVLPTDAAARTIPA